MGKKTRVICADCGHEEPYHPLQQDCSQCGGSWREFVYEFQGMNLPSSLIGRPFDMWRYQELLPLQAEPGMSSLGEGGTPLIHAPNLGAMFNLPNLYIKDERQNPTASFKDRQAALTVALLLEHDIREAVVASTGNVAISYSAYCARAGIKLWAFLTSLVPADKMHEVALYGTRVVKVTSTYDQAKALAARFAEERRLYLDRGTKSVAAVESMKTIGMELAEQFGTAAGEGPGATPSPWQAPDWYLQAVSGGIGPVGVLKGFRELRALGFVDRSPALGGIQTEGCSPMVSAWEEDRATVEPVLAPRTRISTLSTGDPGRAYTHLYTQMKGEIGGAFVSVTDAEAYAALRTVARMEGLSMEPAAAVAFAGLQKLVERGRIQPHHTVVVNCSGHTLPVEKSTLGKGWSADLSSEQLDSQVGTPSEGLLAALAELDRARTREILIVDDHAPARTLIHRILKSQGEFLIREASTGAEAVTEAVRRPPDLIILDLMMPEMDGFDVLDRLKENQPTRQIPIIVVTAKELTTQERAQLEGQIARLMYKGDSLTDELLEEIRPSQE